MTQGCPAFTPDTIHIKLSSNVQLQIQALRAWLLSAVPTEPLRLRGKNQPDQTTDFTDYTDWWDGNAWVGPELSKVGCRSAAAARRPFI
jgi:hypothetical protein